MTEAPALQDLPGERGMVTRERYPCMGGIRVAIASHNMPEVPSGQGGAITRFLVRGRLTVGVCFPSDQPHQDRAISYPPISVLLKFI